MDSTTYEVNPNWFAHLGGRDFATKGLEEGLSHVGGYTLQGLDCIITDAFGSPMSWDLYSVPLPSNDEHLPLLRSLLDCAQWANIRKGKIHLLFVHGVDPVWGQAMAGAGLRILNSPKVAKRVAGLLARRALSTFRSELSIKEISLDHFLPKGHTIDADDVEKVLDGAGVINRALFEHMMMTWESRVAGSYPEHQVQAMGRRFDTAIMVNTRVFTPDGLLKGNFFIMDSFQMEKLYGGVYDFIIPEGQVKPGVFMPEGSNFITCEVQSWHERVNCDPQTQVTLRSFHTDAFVTDVVKDFFASVRKNIDEGTILDTVADRLKVETAALANGADPTKYADQSNRWNAAEWVASGLNLLHAPSLLSNVAGAKVRQILPPITEVNQNGWYRFPLPCVWYMQAVSQSSAQLYGYTDSVVSGTCRIWDEAKLAVISDEDYVANYDNFGGSDMDDFFKVWFRTVNGRKSIILTRNPNGYGEYGLFDYVEGDVHPTWERNDGNIVTFPPVKGSLPKQLATALADGEIKILDLENDIDHLYTDLPVTKEDVWEKINAALAASISVGTLVNAVSLWNLVMGRHCPVGYGTLETYVDLTTQEEVTKEAALRLSFFARFLVNAVVASGRPIDKKFFIDKKLGNQVTNRGTWDHWNFDQWFTNPSLWENEDSEKAMLSMVTPVKAKDRMVPNLVTTGREAFFTVRFSHITAEADKFLDYVQNLCATAVPVPGLMALASMNIGVYGRRWNQATGMSAVLRAFRYKAYLAGDNKDNAWWDQAHAGILSDIKDDSDNEDNTWYNNVIALAGACFEHRTGNKVCAHMACKAVVTGAVPPTVVDGVPYGLCSTHRIELEKTGNTRHLKVNPVKDYLVTNREVFPLYIEALREYGLAGSLSLDEDEAEPMHEWPVCCPSCGTDHTFTNPLHLQRYLKRGVCVTCFSNTKE